MKINGELSRWQQTYQQLMESGGGSSNDMDPQMSRLKEMYESMTVEFMNIKTTLCAERLLTRITSFLCTSAAWLVHLSALGDDAPLVLQHVPEYFVTNIGEFFIFVSRFVDSRLHELLVPSARGSASADVSGNNSGNCDYLNALVSLTVAYMGHADRLFNPHCRAQLAECLEILLPKASASVDDSTAAFGAQMGKRVLAVHAFARHPEAARVSEALLNVFVSIEMSGQSVQFEQKFNYRRPMYELIDFLWNMGDTFGGVGDRSDVSDNATSLFDQHRRKMCALANEAHANIENSEQPLFLKFLNYLINDANYLLLEGLLQLEKIKQAQEKQDRDDWERINATPDAPRSLNNSQRAELDANLKHMIMIAKFHNLMSMKTLHTIQLLTSRIKAIFCMHFLLQLTSEITFVFIYKIKIVVEIVQR